MPKYSPEREGEIIIAPKKTEKIAKILCQQYLKEKGVDQRPAWEQREWDEIIAASSADRKFGAKLKSERDKLREGISSLISQLIKNHELEDVSETKRGEIIAATIQKLAEGPKQSETKKR